MAKIKKFATLQKQLEIQRDIRYLKCKNTDEVKRDLLKYNYFNIINAFEDVLLEKGLDKKVYVNKKFNDYKTLYSLDRFLADNLFSNLLKIENELKTAMAYFFCESYCRENVNQLLNYIKLENYGGALTSGANKKQCSRFENHILFSKKTNISVKCKKIKFTGSIKDDTRGSTDLILAGKFVGDFQGTSKNEFSGELSFKKSEFHGTKKGIVNNYELEEGLCGRFKCKTYIDYCKIKYPHISTYMKPPMWIIINTLTIKQLYYLYIGMDEVIKTKIIQAVSSKNFYFDSSLDKGAFLNAFELIAEVRNKVFHGDNVTLIRSPNNFAINLNLVNRLNLNPVRGKSYEIRLMDIIKIFELFNSFDSSVMKKKLKRYLWKNRILNKNDINRNLLERIGKIN